MISIFGFISIVFLFYNSCLVYECNCNWCKASYKYSNDNVIVTQSMNKHEAINTLLLYHQIIIVQLFPKSIRDYFVKSIFANDPLGQHKTCGMATLLRNLIL